MQRRAIGPAFGLCVIALAFAWAADLAAQQPSRSLAPGVLTVIPAEIQEEETFTGPIALEGLPVKEWTPNFSPKSQTAAEMAKTVVLRRGVWCLEFAFKPLRMIEVDVPQASGRMQRKTIWYMVYRVKNTGYHLDPLPQTDPFGHTTYETKEVNRSVRFFPSFILETHDLASNNAYLDRVIPAALEPIRRRERIDSPLYDSVGISAVDIPWSEPPADNSVWGIATWEDIDPRIDFFSIYVTGLSNSYELRQSDDEPALGAPESPFKQKSLRLVFWRPGDAEDEHEKEIRYGVPLVSDENDQRSILTRYTLEEPLDHLWVYR